MIISGPGGVHPSSIDLFSVQSTNYPKSPTLNICVQRNLLEKFCLK